LLAALTPAIATAQIIPPSPPTVPITGTAPRAIALDEAVRIAESQSEAIRIARAGVERAHGQQYQARSQLLPQISGSAAYTRTLASQFSSVGGGPAVDTTKPAAPPAPCDQYLLDAPATTAERLAGLEDASRCALGSNPFSSFGSLGFGAKNQYNLIELFLKDKVINLDWSDEVIAKTALTHAGEIKNEAARKAIET